jgi:uncharacterized protein YmfQ (DUF2313 family)
MTTINRYSEEQFTNFLAELLPQGRAMAQKYREGTNTRRYLGAKSKEFKRFFDSMVDFIEQLDPRTTDIYLSEWESALGIPCQCIPLETDKVQRRNNIILKLSSLSVQTEQDYINLAALYGFTIAFDTTNAFPYTFPMTFDESTCIGGFPYTFPLILTSGDPSIDKFLFCISGNFDTDPTAAEIFQCLVKLLIPCGYRAVFVNT